MAENFEVFDPFESERPSSWWPACQSKSNVRLNAEKLNQGRELRWSWS
ncbi:hypothetical protein [Burkholderia ubonensis]|nr:hypothetical protein [Burkholderia ubonensis]